jgi:hypothetical protein
MRAMAQSESPARTRYSLPKTATLSPVETSAGGVGSTGPGLTAAGTGAGRSRTGPLRTTGSGRLTSSEFAGG